MTIPGSWSYLKLLSKEEESKYRLIDIRNTIFTLEDKLVTAKQQLETEEMYYRDKCIQIKEYFTNKE